MKVIDFEKRGNVIRLYFGEDDDNDYWGDDWDDAPYEHNAGKVYSNYVEEIKEYAFPFSCFVSEAADDWSYNRNSPFSKEDMKKGKCPCLIINKLQDGDDVWDITYSMYLGSKSENVLKIYFNDDFNMINDEIKKIGGILF